MPEKDTLAAVTSVALRSSARRTRPVFTPRARASFSPRLRRFSCHLRRKRGTIPMTMAEKARGISDSLVPEREPISQYVIGGSWFEGSATSLI